MSEPEPHIVYVKETKHGFGILDWLNDTFLMRFLRFLAPLAILFGAYGFMLDLGNRRASRDAEAWKLITTSAPGNSGKIEALEYLNTSLRIPNPRKWNLPFGWKLPIGPMQDTCGEDYTDGVPDIWALICDFGPFKPKTPLNAIDLSGTREFDGKKWEKDVYLSGLKLPSSYLFDAHLEGVLIDHADLHRARLIGARLTSASLDNTDLEDAQLDRAGLCDAGLWGTLLNRAQLSFADMRFAFVRGASFEHANLTRANLARAILWNANFNHANLTNAELAGAEIQDTDLRNVSGLTQRQIDSACIEGGTILPNGLSKPPPCKNYAAYRVQEVCASTSGDDAGIERRWSRPDPAALELDRSSRAP